MPSIPWSRLRITRSRLPRIGMGALLVALIPIAFMSLVWQQASVNGVVMRMEVEKQTHRDLESQVNALRLEANRLSSLGQVEARAERELGLIRPETDQIVDLVFTPREGDHRFGLRSLVSEAHAETRWGRKDQ